MHTSPSELIPGNTGVAPFSFGPDIDLNPLRAGLVERPEQYRWNSLGFHVQTNNRDNFLSTDFGLKSSILLRRTSVSKAKRSVSEDIADMSTKQER